jgi:hypothetical protein
MNFLDVLSGITDGYYSAGKDSREQQLGLQRVRSGEVDTLGKERQFDARDEAGYFDAMAGAEVAAAQNRQYADEVKAIPNSQEYRAKVAELLSTYSADDPMLGVALADLKLQNGLTDIDNNLKSAREGTVANSLFLRRIAKNPGYEDIVETGLDENGAIVVYSPSRLDAGGNMIPMPLPPGSENAIIEYGNNIGAQRPAQYAQGQTKAQFDRELLKQQLLTSQAQRARTPASVETARINQQRSQETAALRTYQAELRNWEARVQAYTRSLSKDTPVTQAIIDSATSLAGPKPTMPVAPAPSLTPSASGVSRPTVDYSEAVRQARQRVGRGSVGTVRPLASVTVPKPGRTQPLVDDGYFTPDSNPY